MKKLAFVLPVAVAATLGWSGAISPVFAETAAPAQAVQKQGTIEHMKTVRIGGNSITVFETWFNPSTGLERYDKLHYSKKTTELSKETRFSNNESSLFERTIKRYQNESFWKSIGVVTVNGKQVELLKGNGEPKGDPVYRIAYIDQSTRLPIKEEDYNSKDEVMTVYLYFFDRIHDETGEIFQKK